MPALILPLPTTERGRSTHITGNEHGFVYCNKNNVLVYLADGRHLIYRDHVKKTTAAALAPNGKWVCSGDESGAVRVWGLNEGMTLKGEYHFWSGEVKDVCWTVQDRIAVAGSGNSTKAAIFTWDTGSRAGEIAFHSKSVNSISLRPCKPYRCVTGSEDFLVAFYAGPPFKFGRSYGHHSNFVYATAYSPDGKHFVSVGGDAKLFLYDGETGDLVQEVVKPAKMTGSVYGVAWGPDGRFATCGGDKCVRVWAAGEQVKCWGPIGTTPGDMIVGITWTDKIRAVCLDSRILVIDPEAGFDTILGTQGTLTSLVAHKGELAYGSTCHHICVTKEKGTAIASRLQMPKQVSHVFSMGDTLLFSTLENVVYLFGDEPTALANISEHVIGMGAATADSLLVGTSKGHVKAVSISKKAISWTSALRDTPTCFAACSRWVAQGCEFVPSSFNTSGDRVILLYEVQEGLGTPVELKFHARDLTALAFSPCGMRLASGDAGGKIYVWDLETKTVIIKQFCYHTARVSSLCWRADGRGLVSGSLDRSVIIWSLDDPTQKTVFANVHKDGVTSVAFYGDRAAAVGADGVLSLN